jgi:hypothetical protein
VWYKQHLGISNALPLPTQITLRRLLLSRLFCLSNSSIAAFASATSRSRSSTAASVITYAAADSDRSPLTLSHSSIINVAWPLRLR